MFKRTWRIRLRLSQEYNQITRYFIVGEEKKKKKRKKVPITRPSQRFHTNLVYVFDAIRHTSEKTTNVHTRSSRYLHHKRGFCIRPKVYYFFHSKHISSSNVRIFEIVGVSVNYSQDNSVFWNFRDQFVAFVRDVSKWKLSNSVCDNGVWGQV